MPDDDTLLSRRGIVVRQQPRCDEEVSTLSAERSKDVVFDSDGECHRKSVFSALEEHYQSPLNR
ncbi:hypothetical protein ACMD2_19205 [Ananas comosus]|uniref:Uncharacterized protein n=1 Tax=Ananas comosus TaxID=4615 RepID=A0A199USC9_ANACO|nr:hypothetical protein ACMD2_19205 [Ananas comosus]